MLSLMLPTLLACATTSAQVPPPQPTPAIAPVPTPPPPRPQPMMNSIESQNDFAATMAALIKAIEGRGLTTFAVIDHAANAGAIGETLRPTTLVLFGNPKGGTPVIQHSQTAGFDLPLKALVYEDAEGVVHVATTDINRVFTAHRADELTALRERINGLLVEISGEAARGNDE